ASDSGDDAICRWYGERDKVKDRRNDGDGEKCRDKSDSGNLYNSNSNSFGQGRDNLNE
ncbi:unnamed protein product, partial [Dovyalis caffra]